MRPYGFVANSFVVDVAVATTAAAAVVVGVVVTSSSLTLSLYAFIPLKVEQTRFCFLFFSWG